jgi:hypothetical protein
MTMHAPKNECVEKGGFERKARKKSYGLTILLSSLVFAFSSSKQASSKDHQNNMFMPHALVFFYYSTSARYKFESVSIIHQFFSQGSN